MPADSISEPEHVHDVATGPRTTINKIGLPIGAMQPGALGRQLPEIDEIARDNEHAWKIYRERVKGIDQDLLEGWHDTLNSLLIFAGLFSAACTAFLIEVTKNLQTDWQRATSLAVFAIYIRLDSNSTAPFKVPDPTTFTPPWDARWINALWFASLTLALAVSLLAILAKQWLNEFQSRMRAPISTSKMWAMRHSAFKGGLSRWGMSTFISTLPLLLHTALFLFLAGLCLFLFPLDKEIALFVIVVTGIVGIFYYVTGLAPVIWGDCPTATPILRHAYSLWQYSRLGPVLRWTFITLYLVLIAYPGVVIFGMPYAAYVWHRTGDWDLRKGPVYDAMCYIPRRLYVDGEGQEEENAEGKGEGKGGRKKEERMHTMLRYQSRKSVTPAFDQAMVLASDGPLREASVLAWMIRTLPSQNDINATLCTVGSLSKGAHYAYFQEQKRNSPLENLDIQRAAVDALNAVVQDVDPDDAMVASLLRACLFVAVKPLSLAASTKRFLSRYPKQAAYHLYILSLSIIDGTRALPADAAPQVADLDGKLAELIAFSGSLGPLCRSQVKTTLVATAAVSPTDHESVVLALESDMLKNEDCRKSGWMPRISEDLRVRFLTVLDVGLRYPASLQVADSDLHFIVSAYGAAAQRLVSDTTDDPLENLQDRLRLTTSNRFRDYDFSPADLNAIGTLILRNPTWGQDDIIPIALCNLLNHKSLVIGPDAFAWIRTAFHSESNPKKLVSGLKWYPSVKVALCKSNLNLLRPVKVSSNSSSQPVPTPIQSPWSRLLSVVPAVDNAEPLAEMSLPYTVRLLALHRRGYRATAQTLLRELLPPEWAATMISRNSVHFYHLTIHAKVISRKWWTDVRQLLEESTRTWTEDGDYAVAATFVNAVSAEVDCLDCAHDEIRIRWGAEPVLPRADEPESRLAIGDLGVWDPSQARRRKRPALFSGHRVRNRGDSERLESGDGASQQI